MTTKEKGSAEVVVWPIQNVFKNKLKIKILALCFEKRKERKNKDEEEEKEGKKIKKGNQEKNKK